MRRICGILVFSMLWFSLPSRVTFSQSLQDISRARDIPGEEPGAPAALVAQDRDPAQADEDTSGEDLMDPFAEEGGAEPVERIADPLEPINRAFFHFNDRLYFWLLKPLAIGYRTIFPQPVRIHVRNFFDHLKYPIRFVNALLQGKLDGAGRETQRFVVNTIAGLGGFFDVAGENLGVKGQDEDLGQTLAFYGLGPGFYINWPILGPSSLTDTMGMAGDGFLDPLNYVSETEYILALRAYSVLNNTSLTIGEYEDLKRAALDPYIAVRDAYFQYRRNKTKE